MDLSKLIDDYRDAVNMNPQDLLNTERRAQICYECDIDDSELTEQWAIAYALDGIVCQNSGPFASAEMRKVSRACIKKLHSMGESSSIY